MTSQSDTARLLVWNPANNRLEIADPNAFAITFVGFAPSCKRRCANRVAQKNIALAKSIIRSLLQPSLTEQQMGCLLFNLAKATLCQKTHQDQAASLSNGRYLEFQRSALHGGFGGGGYGRNFGAHQTEPRSHRRDENRRSGIREEHRQQEEARRQREQAEQQKREILERQRQIREALARQERERQEREQQERQRQERERQERQRQKWARQESERQECQHQEWSRRQERQRQEWARLEAERRTQREERQRHEADEQRYHEMLEQARINPRKNDSPHNESEPAVRLRRSGTARR